MSMLESPVFVPTPDTVDVGVHDELRLFVTGATVHYVDDESRHVLLIHKFPTPEAALAAATKFLTQ